MNSINNGNNCPNCAYWVKKVKELRDHVAYLEERVETLEISNSKFHNLSDEYWNNWYSSDLLYAETKRELDELQNGVGHKHSLLASNKGLTVIKIYYCV